MLAAGLVMCDPILLAQSTLVMTETLATLLAVVAVGALAWAGRNGSPWQAAIAGLCLGLAALCRPTFLAPAAMAAVLLPLLVPGRRNRLLSPLCLLAGVALLIGPWALRNQIYLGRPIVGTTHGGYTFLLGNNPYFYQYLRSGPWGSVWDARELQQAKERQFASAARLSEVDADQLAYREAMDNIRREPGMFAYSCLVRVGRLWGLIPHQLSPNEPAVRRFARYAVGLWYAIELAAAALGLIMLIRRRNQPGNCKLPQEQGNDLGASAAARLDCQGWAWWLVLAISFTGVHAFYWSDMRMRAPLMPGVALAAAVGARRLAAAIPGRRSQQAATLGK